MASIEESLMAHGNVNKVLDVWAWKDEREEQFVAVVEGVDIRTERFVLKYCRGFNGSGGSPWYSPHNAHQLLIDRIAGAIEYVDAQELWNDRTG